MKLLDRITIVDELSETHFIELNQSYVFDYLSLTDVVSHPPEQRVRCSSTSGFLVFGTILPPR